MLKGVLCIVSDCPNNGMTFPIVDTFELYGETMYLVGYHVKGMVSAEQYRDFLIFKTLREIKGSSPNFRINENILHYPYYAIKRTNFRDHLFLIHPPPKNNVDGLALMKEEM